MATVGENIKRIRKEKGWTQKKLSEQSGVHEMLISRYERNVLQPKNENLSKISQALEIPVLELFIDKENNAISEKNLFRAVDIDIEYSQKYLIDTFTEKGLNNLLLVKEYLLANGYDLLEVDENDNFTFMCSVKSNFPIYVLTKEELIKLESLIKNTFDLFFDIKKDGFFSGYSKDNSAD